MPFVGVPHGRLNSERSQNAHTADPEDKRSAIVEIAPEGRKVLKGLRRRKTAYLARTMRELPEDDVETLTRAAEILERVLEEDRR